MTRRARQSGFSLIEVAVAVAILAVALTGLLGAMTLAMRGSAYSGELLLAQDAARAKVEEMGGHEHRLIFCRFNTVTSDDPESPPLPNTGSTFDVRGLTPVTTGTKCGRIVFPTNNAGSRLRETPPTAFLDQHPDLGMPKDLNNADSDQDGDFDNDVIYDQDTGYSEFRNVLLPAKIVITWSGATGPQTYQLCVQFMDRTPK